MLCNDTDKWPAINTEIAETQRT